MLFQEKYLIIVSKDLLNREIIVFKPPTIHIICVNYNSEDNLFVKFLDNDSNVLDTLTMKEFEDMMIAQSSQGLPNPPPPGV